MGPTKAQKFKDKGVVVLSRRGLSVLVPCIGLLSPEDVDFRELAENIALANPDILDARTMDAVLKGIVKNSWLDSLPYIRRRATICTAASKRAYSVPKTSFCCTFPGKGSPDLPHKPATYARPTLQQFRSFQALLARLEQECSTRTWYSWTCGGFRVRD